jgi:IS30 family transposase
MLWANKLPLTLFEVPRALRHKRHRKWVRQNKRIKGRCIDERPAIVNDGTEIGHWEVDTVVGQRAGREAVILPLWKRSRVTTLLSASQDVPVPALKQPLHKLQDFYGIERFSQIFKTMRQTMVLSLRPCRSSRALAPRFILRIRTAHGNDLRTNVTMAC